MSIDNYEQYKTVINQFIITLGDYTCMYIIYTLETKKYFVCVVIYNKLLLNHLWSCVLKLTSELHDFI